MIVCRHCKRATGVTKKEATLVQLIRDGVWHKLCRQERLIMAELIDTHHDWVTRERLADILWPYGGTPKDPFMCIRSKIYHMRLQMEDSNLTIEGNAGCHCGWRLIEKQTEKERDLSRKVDRAFRTVPL